MKRRMIMKTTKRFIAMAAALALTTCAAMPMASFAASGGSNAINITNSDGATHTYEAYQVFAGEFSGGVLRNINWGDGVSGSGVLAALHTASGATGNVLNGLFPDTVTDAKGVAEVLSGFDNDSDKAQAFADIVGANLTPAKSGAFDADNNRITGLPDGYYLVQDGSNPANGAKTRFIVQVTDQSAVTVNAKHSVPSVEKKVKENVKNVTGKPINDSETSEKWNDVADYNIGDYVPFKLYGTLPSTYADYDHYYYKFTDTLATGLTAPSASAITVKVNGKAITNAEGNMRVTVSGQNSTVSYEDIKVFAPNQSDVITVEYSAILDTDANIGLNGNENSVKLEYSNNPNFEYNPNTGDNNEDKPKDDNGTPEDTSDDTDETNETIPDKVIVFTYNLEINKTDSGTTKLAGAKFCVKATTGTNAGKWVKVDSNNKVSGWLPEQPTANSTEGVFTSSAAANEFITISGLDDGTYEITELVAPAGYNNLASSLTWVIEATTANNQTWNGAAATALTDIDLKENGTTIDQKNDNNNRTVQGKIVNQRGSTLPTTGGMGTTLFILGGGCAAGLAGIYLVSKKRAKEDAE